ncbi:MAG: type I glyceraldehyde-3-phosphate dehydrogenase [Deltaproteobacteria bacterium]|nr:type I glyceraldehyde-3-phosphate dehydrogenase [Deltaproteobacteria bacterium]
MAIKIGINGFGRIGRCVTRILFDKGMSDKFDLVHINDITDNDTLAHLLKYDSVHRRFDKPVELTKNGIAVDGKDIEISSIRDPGELPWKDKGVDVVLECTGLFRTSETAGAHLKAGAGRVLLSAPPSGPDIRAFVYGVNHTDFDAGKDQILSNASCTTNCLAPVAKVIHENFGILHGLMTTIHAYTNDQRLLDLPHKDLRRARAAAVSMIPTTTGAARAVGMVLPELKGKLDGFAIRVPTPNVSVVDLVVRVEKATSAEQINAELKAASEGSLKGVMGFDEEPLVSIDYCGDPRSSIVSASNTTVIDGTMVKILSWYDNEWGFSNRMLDMVAHIAG